MDEGRDGRREIERNVENFCLSVWVKPHEASRPLQKITTAGEKQSWGHGWTGDGGCGGMLYEGQWALRTKIKRRTYLQNRGEERAVCLRVCASQPEGVWQEWQCAWLEEGNSPWCHRASQSQHSLHPEGDFTTALSCFFFLPSFIFSCFPSIFQSLVPTPPASAPFISPSLMSFYGGEAYAQLAVEAWQKGTRPYQFTVFQSLHNISMQKTQDKHCSLCIDLCVLLWKTQH